MSADAVGQRGHELVDAVLRLASSVTEADLAFLTDVRPGAGEQQVRRCRSVVEGRGIEEGTTFQWGDVERRWAMSGGAGYQPDVAAPNAAHPSLAALGVRAYAACAVPDEDGSVSASICLAGYRPASIAPKATELLPAFAELVAQISRIDSDRAGDSIDEHVVMTPLTVILGWSKLLASLDLASTEAHEEVRKGLDTIVRNAEKLQAYLRGGVRDGRPGGRVEPR